MSLAPLKSIHYLEEDVLRIATTWCGVLSVGNAVWLLLSGGGGRDFLPGWTFYWQALYFLALASAAWNLIPPKIALVVDTIFLGI